MNTDQSPKSANTGWAVRRMDTHHYLVSVTATPSGATAAWAKNRINTLPFAEHAEAYEWVKYFGNRTPCYVQER